MTTRLLIAAACGASLLAGAANAHPLEFLYAFRPAPAVSDVQSWCDEVPTIVRTQLAKPRLDDQAKAAISRQGDVVGKACAAALASQASSDLRRARFELNRLDDEIPGKYAPPVVFARDPL